MEQVGQGEFFAGFFSNLGRLWRSLFASQEAYNHYNDNEHAKTDMYIEHYIKYW